jgi:hypothetical protein
MPDSEPLSRQERGPKRAYEPPAMSKISREEAMRLLREAASPDLSDPQQGERRF